MAITPTTHPYRPSSCPIKEARALVAAWRTSGEGRASWCRTRGILPSMLKSYVHRVEGYPPRASRRVGDGVGGFIPVVVREHEGVPTGPAANPGFQPVVELPGGIRVTGLPITGVVTLVQALCGVTP